MAIAGPVVAGHQFLRWPDGDAFTTFGPNELILIDIGAIEFVTSCPEMAIEDFIWPFADIYVIPSGSGQSGAALSDVTGSKNTAWGASGGGVFVSQILGVTAPSGSLGPGTYAVVFDECQNGIFDGPDFVADPAFRVVIPADLPAPPISLDFKDRARTQAFRLRSMHAFTKALFFVAQLAGKAKAPGASRPSNESLGRMISLAGDAIKKTGLRLVDIKAGALSTILQVFRYHDALAKDPPDPDFDQVTTLGPRPAFPSHDPDPLVRQGIAASAEASIDEALLLALLQSLERYQGAQAEGDGSWGLAQARSALEYAGLLADHADDSALAFAALGTEVAGADVTLDDFTLKWATFLSTVESSGLPAEESVIAANFGIPPTVIDDELEELLGVDFASFSRAAMATAAADVATSTSDFGTGLVTFIGDMAVLVAAIEADPVVLDFFPVADAGGPYDGTVGIPLSLDGSTSSGDIVAFAWDLDGDGDFDDDATATPTYVPDRPRHDLVGLEVITATGDKDVGYAWLTVAAVNRLPEVQASSPGFLFGDIEIGSSRTFSVVPSDPDSDPVTVEWFYAGALVASGVSAILTPLAADAGTALLEAVLDDGKGGLSEVAWPIAVFFPDPDGDGWSSNLDCDETDAAVNPGATDVLNGIDDDCNPSTPDGGLPPEIVVGSAPSGTEGEAATLDATFTHAELATETFTAEVSWGDGQSETVGVTAGAVHLPHTWVEDGSYPVELCIRTGAGARGCVESRAGIANAPPTSALQVDLTLWTPEVVPGTFATTGSQWVVSAERDTVVQVVNGSPTFFISDFELDPADQLSLALSVLSGSGDDDFIGFAFGMSTGDTTNPTSDYLLFSWKRSAQRIAGEIAPRGLRLVRVQGTPTPRNFWSHEGAIQFLQDAATLGDARWNFGVEYAFSFRILPGRLQVFVDGGLEFDVNVDVPPGGVAFYNYSQGGVRYSGVRRGALGGDEGSLLSLDLPFSDPGILDVHTATANWGDGSPLNALDIVESSGAGAVSGKHAYRDNGSYDVEVCVRDDEGAEVCGTLFASVGNVAPVVDAGPDTEAGPVLHLAASFSDAGADDTHTATVDWGDLGPVEPVPVEGGPGGGTLAAPHLYASDGLFDVEVCVTDDDGDQGCDTRQVTMSALNQPPILTLDTPPQADEGSTILYSLSFVDANPSDVHQASVDWGDGTFPEALSPFNDGGSVGFGTGSHIYLDDGLFPIVMEICDPEPACASGNSEATIHNVPPSVLGGIAVDGDLVTLTGTFTDPGILDTHFGMIDWGDGSSSPAVLGPFGSSGATLAGTHTYSASGAYPILVCVSDDDGGEGCVNLEATLSADREAVPIPTLEGLGLMLLALLLVVASLTIQRWSRRRPRHSSRSRS